MFQLIVTVKNKGLSENILTFGPYESIDMCDLKISQIKEHVIFSNSKKDFMVEDLGVVFQVKKKGRKVIQEFRFTKKIID